MSVTNEVLNESFGGKSFFVRNIECLYYFLIVLQFVFFFLKVKTGSNSFMVGYFCVSAVIFVLIFKGEPIRISSLLFFMVLIFFMIVFSFFSRSYPYYYSAYLILYGVSSLGAALLLSRLTNATRLFAFVFYLYLFFLLQYIVRFGGDVERYNEVLAGSSRNYLSMILFMITSALIVSAEKEGRPLPVIPVIVSFAVCLILYGRSGILMSAALAVLVFLSGGSYRRIFAVSVLTIFFIFGFGYAWEYILTSSNFHRGFSSERELMFMEYVRGMNLYDFLFGRSYDECCRYIIAFDNNPHNSFVMGHARYGVIHIFLGFLVFFFPVRSWLVRGIIFLFFIRYSLDQVGLFSPYDVFLFYIVLAGWGRGIADFKLRGGASFLSFLRFPGGRYE